MSYFSSEKVSFQEPTGKFWWLDKFFNYRGREFFISFFQVFTFSILSVCVWLLFHYGVINASIEIPEEMEMSWKGLIYIFTVRLETAVSFNLFTTLLTLLCLIFIIGFFFVVRDEKYYKKLWVVFFATLSVMSAGICTMGGGVFLLAILNYAINEAFFPTSLAATGFLLILESVAFYMISRFIFLNFFEKIVMV